MELDCQACGACCHGDEGWIHLDIADDVRIDASSALRALVVPVRLGGGHLRRSLRMVGGRCAGLADTATGVTCSVYRDRPSVCREVEAGSDECLKARARRGTY